MEREKKGCLIPIAFMAVSIICIILGIEFDIHILFTLGFMLPAYGGTMYKQFTIKDKNKRWDLKKHLIMIFSLIVITLFITFIGYGKLW